MTDNLYLTFPKRNCTDVNIKGENFVQVNVGMSSSDFLMKLMEYVASGDNACAIMKKDKKE